MDTSILKQLKEQNMVLFLERIGHHPKKINGHSYWFFSPFRMEQTPSFKVSTGLFGIDLFWDYGTGEHGNLVDFCCLYYNLTPKELYHQIRSNAESFLFDQPTKALKSANQKEKSFDGTGLMVRAVQPIAHPSLMQYLRSRAILPEIYNQFCKEVHYQVGQRSYFAVGFSNDQGGWELRNPYFKGASSPKCYSLVAAGAETVIVFEGFMDFLSFLTIKQKAPDYLQVLPTQSDYLILNSLALWNKALSLLKSYSTVNLMLDRDPQGRMKTKEALAISKKFLDRCDLFVGAKDINDWLIKQEQLRSTP